MNAAFRGDLTLEAMEKIERWRAETRAILDDFPRALQEIRLAWLDRWTPIGPAN